jgi:serine/threonine-protein kinase
MLVSWTRLISGRGRDPLVGRDLLIGAAAGATVFALGLAVSAAGARAGLTQVPTLLGGGMLESLTSLPHTGVALAYGGSVMVLDTLETVVLLLLLRLVLRRTDLAVAGTMLILGLTFAFGEAPNSGWPIAILSALLTTLGVLVIMRFGLLAGVTMLFVVLVMNSTVATFDLSAWYADRALVPAAILVAILAYGAATALAGKPILGDPLREPAGR